jgi:hypothetical protein
VGYTGNRHLWVACAGSMTLAVGFLSLAGRIPGEQTTRGPEPAAPARNAVGCLVAEGNPGELTLTKVLSLEQKRVRFLSAEEGPKVRPRLHALAGPDNSGRIAFFEEWIFVPEKEKRHLLK